MGNTGKSLAITLLITLSAFLSVTYTACKKTVATPTADLCKSITCQNGGNCYKGKCSCPGGYDGDYCEVKALGKYIGNWVLTEKVTGSNRSINLHVEKKYEVTINEVQGSNVDFVINNFMGNDNFDNVPCRIGTNAKQETISSYYDFGFMSGTVASSPYYVISGGGTINNFGSFINGSYIRSYPDSAGIVTDSLSIFLER